MAGRLRAFACVALAVAELVLFTALPRGAAGEKPPSIKIGLSAGFSGPTRAMALELYRGAQAAFAARNREGGIHGHPVELLAADDRYQPDPAIENIVRFLVADKVLTLFSSLGTPTVSRELPVLRAYAKQGARLFFPVSGLQASRVPPYVRYVYNLRASYRQEIEGLVAAFVAQGRSRIAICHQADAFGRSGWDGARRALAKRGLSLCGEATFARSVGADEDMTRQVVLLADCHPDAVLIVGPAPACAALIRDLRGHGLTMPVGVVSFAGGEILLRVLIDEGKRCGRNLEDGLVMSQVTPDWRDSGLPASRDYRRDLAALAHAPVPPGGWDKHPLAGSATGFEGYLNARLLLAVLAAMADPQDRAGLDAAVASLGPVDLGIGVPVVLTGPHHQGLDKVYLSTASRGRLVPLTSMRIAAGD
ncbi:conserved hypothetical protein [Solidesulfovibrio fructosivorans JJ]]|uniref:Leucine-binding protein domain-containing protein n=1 Tax=Solidesulfovibrio fructosivorans JJ] TaxID=596151 RepID=E1JZ93_SOLFR|nr:ABC transporter substrate-binding protein [Solidesulfovibrio fructosivorans]EFL50376.1 conserved hypothetical protein [Solidesulfovibrio fructosivorans JJ]]